MDLSNLYSTPGSHKSAKRLGRGDASGKGGTSGKGTKGLIRRLPKRGFKNPARVAYTPVNLSALNAFKDGTTVDAAALLSLGLVKAFANGGFKVLAKGELTSKNLQVKANAVSEKAKSIIEAAGGSVELV